ncbi:hypothetical protein [Actinokineospora sp. NPDC004072]
MAGRSEETRNSARLGGDNSGTIYQADRIAIKHNNRSRMPLLVGFAVLGAALAIAVPLALKQEPAETPPRDVVVAATAFRLVPSSDPTTNNTDKVDLDTGCPGWGPTRIRVGPSRCGELADLILEDDKIHTPGYAPLISRPAGAGCDDRTAAAVAAVAVTDLRPGAVLCVRTDKGNTADVRVDEVGPAVVISFQTWR